MLTLFKASLIISLVICASACTPGYVCPLGAGPGTCRSQQAAYKATLTHNADGLSIFNSTSNREGD